MVNSFVQSILFDRHYWSIGNAENWLRNNGYKTSFHNKKVDITKNFLRYRQKAPKPNHAYHIKKLNDYIDLVLMYPLNT